MSVFSCTEWMKRWGCAVGVSVVLLLGGCAPAPPQTATPAAPAKPVVFPLPPEQARVQYLGSISSTSDFTQPRPKGGFAEFILGPEETGKLPIGKALSAQVRGKRLYVCDTDLNTVMIYDLVTGEAHRLKGDSGPGKIRKPNGLDFSDDGRMFIADKLRGSVLVYGPDEAFVGAWGRPGQVSPVSVAVGKTALYVCDIQDHEIEMWDIETGAFRSAFGGQGHEPGLFSLPTHVTLDAEGQVYVSDTGNFRVQKLSPEGKPLQQFGGAGRQPGRFAWPKGVGTDDQGRVYVADSRFCNVQIFDAKGRLLLFFGGPGPQMGNMDLPASVQVLPWPMLEWFDQRLAPGFDPEYLVVVVNQWHRHKVNFFAVAREKAGMP